MTAILASSADTEILAKMLAEAFQEDALTRWITPDDDRRATILPAFFREHLDISLRYLGVHTNADRDAALLFLPPGAWEETETRAEELATRFTDILGREAEAMATISGLQTVHHPTGRPHYYLAFAGVSPSNQRNGTMTALFENLIARIDSERVAAYLEASSAGGLAMAQRYGFLPVGTAIEIPDGPTLRPMWREPQ
nr:GNAT family N-acetyltransferase [Kibdelosporangium sp. MJ126-NF4]CEL17248.1 GCN5-related N-acetyltransferase [Kibdelosporangium sp. MJ126-NF4]CTQ91522.1 GCN5-related N-acetyltransferase [Kibdelosporangium sp. MJ126-NF4]